MFGEKDNRTNDLILSISLGSKSSALLVKADGNIIGAYKEEHFSGIKNDSSFPIKSIFKLLDSLNIQDIYQMTVTLNHWFNSKTSNRTWDRYYTDVEKIINSKYSNIIIKRTIEGNDLHDSLAECAKAYVLYNKIELKNTKITILVANRFGNFENVVSTYKWKNFQSFMNDDEPESNKLKDLSSSIGMMQQIASKNAGFSEYDINRGLMTIKCDLIKTKSNLNLYDKQQDWNKYDSYSEQNLFQNSKQISSEEMISRAIKKSKDIYDFRPINIKKIEQINEYYYPIFTKNIDLVEKSSLIKSMTKDVLLKLIKPHLDGNIILIGDVFVSDKINEALKNESKHSFIVCPLLEDNSAIFGSANKVLENIYYKELNFDIYCVKREDIDLKNFKHDKLNKKVVKYVKDHFFTNLSVDHIVKFLKNGNIVNIIDKNVSFSDRLNSNSISLSIDKLALEYIIEDGIIRENENFIKSELILDIEKAVGQEIYYKPFVTGNNITPIDNISALSALLYQLEKRDFYNLKNDINLIIF